LEGPSRLTLQYADIGRLPSSVRATPHLAIKLGTVLPDLAAARNYALSAARELADSISSIAFHPTQSLLRISRAERS
jgi:hypothetical protein